MQDDPISRVMHGLLTAYSQYHNRKYRQMGHLFQGRYKAILCQSDRYLAELVRYIHLNPVRAKMVVRPEDYEYRGHRAYLGVDRAGLVDTDAVLARQERRGEEGPPSIRTGLVRDRFHCMDGFNSSRRIGKRFSLIQQNMQRGHKTVALNGRVHSIR